MQGMEPTNVTAQIMHSARGNPPSVLANTAISNCFPGLEYDLRNKLLKKQKLALQTIAIYSTFHPQ